ncbi:MAG TPA: VOC family protein [Lacunisphaera sp.]|nr:VOC family protein [Lacunisphaera sp.]
MPLSTLRKFHLLLVLVALSASVSLADTPSSKIQYVGAISINPCQDAKVLADWYAKLGIATKEMYGGYYGDFDTGVGQFVFGIHPRRKDAPAKSSGSVAIVFRVENFAAHLAALKEQGLTPEKVEKDEMGQFAHFHDPDGNKVSIWGK